jgi:hypothetical protein
MPVEPFIRDFDKPSVEGPLGGALLVATYKKYGLPLRVEGERHPPNRLANREAKLFHVRMLGAFERINVRPAKAWPYRLEQQGKGSQLVLNSLRMRYHERAI